MKNKKKSFNQIAKKIKEVKIQGATNIAKYALRAYSLIPSKASKKKLLSLRPTEPMMENILDLAEKGKSKKEILQHLSETQTKINKAVLKLIKNNDIIFTHCHSTNVVKALINAKKKKKKFEVYNTETRPLYQGRKTAKELKQAKIKVIMFVDSAVGVALSGEQKNKKPDKVFLGADAITKKGVINKVGSEVISIIAKNNKIPVYIVANSWKFTKSKVPMENRKLNEVWDAAPKNIKIKNPAFEFVDKKYIKGVVSEFGLKSFGEFVKDCYSSISK